MLLKLVRVTDLPEGSRVHKEVHGRKVTILRHQGKAYALDTSCFHQGGPLGTQGEIEDINGVSCLRCPWHNYRVNLLNGAHVQKDLAGNPCERHGQQQTHNVYDGGDGYFWVDINIDCKPAAASATYNLQRNQGGLDCQGFGLSQRSQTASSMSQGSYQGLSQAFSLSQDSCETAVSIEAESSEDMDTISSNAQPWGIQPFAGIGKRPLVSPASSPVKQKPKVIQVTASAHSAAASQGALSFKGRKQGTSNVRRKLATSAVLQNYKPPPTAKLATVPKGPTQRTIDELFQKQAVTVMATDGATNMQLD